MRKDKLVMTTTNLLPHFCGVFVWEEEGGLKINTCLSYVLTHTQQVAYIGTSIHTPDDSKCNNARPRLLCFSITEKRNVVGIIVDNSIKQAYVA